MYRQSSLDVGPVALAVYHLVSGLLGLRPVDPYSLLHLRSIIRLLDTVLPSYMKGVFERATVF